MDYISVVGFPLPFIFIENSDWEFKPTNLLIDALFWIFLAILPIYELRRAKKSRLNDEKGDPQVSNSPIRKRPRG